MCSLRSLRSLALNYSLYIETNLYWIKWLVVLKNVVFCKTYRHFQAYTFPGMFMHIGDLTSSEVVKAITFTEDSEGEVVLAHLNRLIMESNNKLLCMCKCETC